MGSYCLLAFVLAAGKYHLPMKLQTRSGSPTIQRVLIEHPVRSQWRRIIGTSVEQVSPRIW